MTSHTRRRYIPGLVLTLLTVTFAWSCHKQLPTTPTAPAADTVSFSDKPQPIGSASYTYTGTDDLTFDPDPGSAIPGPGNKNNPQVTLSDNGGPDTMRLSPALVSQWEHGQTCFADALNGFVPFDALVTPVKGQPNDVKAGFFFNGVGTQGTKFYRYTLRLQGTVSGCPGGYPPKDPETCDIEWHTAGIDVQSSGKGKKTVSPCAGPAAAIEATLSITGVD